MRRAHLVVVLAVLGGTAAPVSAPAQATITVTARLGARVLGPDTAVAVSMPGSASSVGGTRHESVLITMRPGRAVADFERLAALAAHGHPQVGVCDFVFRSTAGVVFRTEHLAGCVVTRVAPAGPVRRVWLDYTAISNS